MLTSRQDDQLSQTHNDMSHSSKINTVIARSVAMVKAFDLSNLKGTVPQDFSPLVFFFKQLLLVPVDKPSNDFDFFRIFAEIFDFSGALPVSMTLAMQTILL